MVIHNFKKLKKGYIVCNDFDYNGPYETLEGAKNDDFIHCPKYIIKYEIIKEIK